MENKRIALFGGTGFVGSHMRQALLSRGYQVRMLVRNPDDFKSEVQPPNLSLVYGDLSSYAVVSDVIDSADAVVVVTGPRTGSISDMRAVVEGTRTVVRCMEEQSVSRLLKLSGVSVRVGDEPFSLPRRILDIGLGVAMKYPSQSKYLEQDIIESSNLNWTVVRAPVIRSGRSVRPLQAHDHDFLGLFIRVENLCEFFLRQIESARWIHKSPVVG